MTEKTSDEMLVQQLIEKANSGDLAAQADLGCKYTRGEGVAKDNHEAAKWLRLAADQCHLEAKVAIQQIGNDLKMTKRNFTVQSRNT